MLLVWARFMRLIRRLKPDVLHGHGAKAGAFIRMKPRSKSTIRVYTPHGGSLHYPLNTLKGALYSRLERALMNSTDLFLFESAFARDTYQRTIGTPDRPGALRLQRRDRRRIRSRRQGGRRHRHRLCRRIPAYQGRRPPDRCGGAAARRRQAGDADAWPATARKPTRSRRRSQRLGLDEAVRFIGHVKARYGFSKGTLLVVPSRGDSMPYVVIEAAAAGIPMVAANVGGIPEIFGPHTDALFAPNIVAAMADAIEAALDDPAAALARAKSLRERIFLHFSQKAMVEGVSGGLPRRVCRIVNRSLPTITVSSDLSSKP